MGKLYLRTTYRNRLGSKDSLRIRKYAEWHLDHLNVYENVHLTISIHTEMPDNIKGLTIPLQSLEPDVYPIFKVMIDDKLNKKQQMLVLAHEMIHVKQYVKKDLIPFNEEGVFWKEKKYNSVFAYDQEIPWEENSDLTAVVWVGLPSQLHSSSL